MKKLSIFACKYLYLTTNDSLFHINAFSQNLVVFGTHKQQFIMNDVL